MTAVADTSSWLPPGGRIDVRERLDPVTVRAVRELVTRDERVDGTAPLNESALLRLDGGPARHLLARDRGGALVAYAQLDVETAPDQVGAEVVVDPAGRRAGWGSAVVARVLAEAGGAAVLLWSHGDHPGAAATAGRLGFTRVRDLFQLRRPLGPDAPPFPAVVLPDGVAVRTYVPGRDEQAWLALNARAFADHPEQGGMGPHDLALRTAAGWFDPAGFFLAERDGRLVGFHWTKVHAQAGGPGRPGSEAGPAAGPAVGEVYVVGVDPDEQGGGLGSALTALGLRHLAGLGLREVLLYVEADNAAALRVYRRLGFTHVRTDTQYRHDASPTEATAVR